MNEQWSLLASLVPESGLQLRPPVSWAWTFHSVPGTLCVRNPGSREELPRPRAGCGHMNKEPVFAGLDRERENHPCPPPGFGECSLLKSVGQSFLRGQPASETILGRLEPRVKRQPLTSGAGVSLFLGALGERQYLARI